MVPQIVGILAAGEGVHSCGYTQPIEYVGGQARGKDYGDTVTDYGDGCVDQERSGRYEKGFSITVYRAMDNVSCGSAQSEITGFINRHPGTVAEKLMSPFMKHDAGEGGKSN